MERKLKAIILRYLVVALQLQVGKKNVELYEKLNKALADTGQGVVVTNIKLTKYESDSKISIEGPQPHLQDKSTKSQTELLRELNQLRKEGIISEEEFETKKKEILQRM